MKPNVVNKKSGLKRDRFFMYQNNRELNVIVPADKDVDVAVDLVISHMSNYIQKEIS